MNRVVSLDICKAIAIFLVVYGHILVVYDDRGGAAPIAQCIYSVHCPFFMYLSGIFLSRNFDRGIKEVLVSKMRGLLIPYFVWSVVCLLFVNILYNGFDSVYESVKGFLLGGGISLLLVCKVIIHLYHSNVCNCKNN